jgi:hypothetical protein
MTDDPDLDASAAFRLLVASSLATERGRPAWLDEHRLSVADSLMLLRSPFDETGMETSLKIYRTMVMPTLPFQKVVAFRREDPMIRVSVVVAAGLPIEEAWRDAAVEMLGVMGEDADRTDRLYARIAGVRPPAPRPVADRIDALELVDAMNGLVAPPQGSLWGMMSPTHTTGGLVLRIDPTNHEIVSHRALPSSIAERLDRTMTFEGGRSATVDKRTTIPSRTSALAIMRTIAGLGDDADVLKDALRP